MYPFVSNVKATCTASLTCVAIHVKTLTNSNTLQTYINRLRKDDLRFSPHDTHHNKYSANGQKHNPPFTSRSSFHLADLRFLKL